MSETPSFAHLLAEVVPRQRGVDFEKWNKASAAGVSPSHLRASAVRLSSRVGLAEARRAEALSEVEGESPCVSAPYQGMALAMPHRAMLNFGLQPLRVRSGALH